MTDKEAVLSRKNCHNYSMLKLQCFKNDTSFYLQTWTDIHMFQHTAWASLLELEGPT